jgi:ABC-type antimicrobial peptide transport system permease subunit
VYIPYAQVPSQALGEMTYEVRTDGDPLRQVAAVVRIVHEVAGRMPVTNIRTQAADIDRTMNQEIVFARLCSAFALLAMAIACVGLYATMAYAVARRTGEIGLRMALGAPRGSVIWMVLREVCVLAALGLAIGIPTALGASRFVESFLFGMRPNDPSALAPAAVILVAASFVAAYGPARRASQVDPMIALRHD